MMTQCDSQSRDEFRLGTTTSKMRKCSIELVNGVVGYREGERKKASPEVDSN